MALSVFIFMIFRIISLHYALNNKNSTQNRLLLPGVLSTATEPPISSIMRLVLTRPISMPSTLLVIFNRSSDTKKLSTSFA